MKNRKNREFFENVVVAAFILWFFTISAVVYFNYIQGR